MLAKLFAENIQHEFAFAFTSHQAKAAERIGEFLADPRDDQAFILRGYAGTGKTSLVAAVVRVWQKLERPVVLLAPTGRAAKVLSYHAGIPAYTIHKVIYRQDTFKGEDTHFDRGWNPVKHGLFIVDEASMIPARSGGNTVFGTGELLEDLVHFVFSGSGCKLLMVGDTAQLSPVGEVESPALRPSALKVFGLDVRGAQLLEVVRQESLSPVLREATKLREYLSDADEIMRKFQAGSHELPKVAVDERDPRLQLVPGYDLIDALDNAYRKWGTDQTIVVTRSNKRAIAYNQGIRARIFDYEELLVRGDLVMAVKNNYYWSQQAQKELPKGELIPIPFIANGDCAQVVRYRNVHELYGFTFADATLRFADYDNYELDVRILLDTLTAEAPSLTAEEQQRLFQRVAEDYMHIRNERERMKAIRQDPYYNALQIKYAYAVTCHKAQGGQWHEVFVDQGYIPEGLHPVEYLRWLYTAFTRTSDNLYLVNWPQEQTEQPRHH